MARAAKVPAKIADDENIVEIKVFCPSKFRAKLVELEVKHDIMGEELGVGRHTISSWCNGRTIPNANQFLRALAFMGCSMLDVTKLYKEKRSKRAPVKKAVVLNEF